MPSMFRHCDQCFCAEPMVGFAAGRTAGMNHDAGLSAFFFQCMVFLYSCFSCPSVTTGVTTTLVITFPVDLSQLIVVYLYAGLYYQISGISGLTGELQAVHVHF